MKTSEQEREALLQLARRRQADRPPPPHRRLAEFHGGYYECDYVSPWTISAANVDAELMIIGQDWASSETLERDPNKDRQRLGQDWSSSTNTNLRELLATFMRLTFAETYATNVFPFIKHGAKNADIPLKDMVRYAKTYTLSQIEIVSPLIAICLGKATFDAVRRAAGLIRIEWDEAILPGHGTRVGSAEIYAVPHPGRLGMSNAGGEEAVGLIWKVLADRLETLRKRIDTTKP
jgi:restriction system protein